MVVKFLWPYNIFYSDGISLDFFFVFSLVFVSSIFLQYELLCSRRGLWWLNLLVPHSRPFPSPRTESLMLVILTIFYFCSLYLRFNKNLPAIHCHFFPTGLCLFLRGCCMELTVRECMDSKGAEPPTFLKNKNKKTTKKPTFLTGFKHV